MHINSLHIWPIACNITNYYSYTEIVMHKYKKAPAHVDIHCNCIILLLIAL